MWRRVQIMKLPPPSLWRCGLIRAVALSSLRFLDHSQRRTAVGRISLDEGSPCHRHLDLTTHNKHNTQTSKPPEGVEPTISTGEWPLTHALDRVATRTGMKFLMCNFLHSPATSFPYLCVFSQSLIRKGYAVSRLVE